MTKTVLIKEEAARALKESESCSPERIAEFYGIWIREEDLGSLPGVVVEYYGRKTIIVNARLNSQERQIVIAHELGHCFLHEELLHDRQLFEFTLFNTKNTTEYEANAFAAHLLIDTDEFLRDIQAGYSYIDLAPHFNVLPDLILVKVKELIKMGYQMDLPDEPYSACMADI